MARSSDGKQGGEGREGNRTVGGRMVILSIKAPWSLWSVSHIIQFVVIQRFAIALVKSCFPRLRNNWTNACRWDYGWHCHLYAAEYKPNRYGVKGSTEHRRLLFRICFYLSFYLFPNKALKRWVRGIQMKFLECIDDVEKKKLPRPNDHMACSAGIAQHVTSGNSKTHL